jgi:hypothetical protein
MEMSRQSLKERLYKPGGAMISMKRTLLFSTLIVSLTASWMSVAGCNHQNPTKEPSSVSEKSSVDWVKLYTDTNGDKVFYKIESRAENVVQVWGKRVFSSEGGNEFIRDRIDHGLSIAGMEKIGHFNTLYEIDCKNKTDGVLSVVIYDADGRIILADSFGNTKREYIVPGSIGDSFRKEVCK